MTAIVLLYSVLTILIGTVAILDFMKSRHIRWRFSGVSFKYSLGLFLMNLISALWVFWMQKDVEGFMQGVVGTALQLPLLYIYMCVGCRYSHRLTLPGAVFWKRLSWYPFSVDILGEEDKLIYTLHSDVGKMLYTNFVHPQYLEIQSYKNETADKAHGKWWMKADGIALACIAVASIYTILLFTYARPQASELVENLRQTTPYGEQAEMNAVLMMIVFAKVAITEEIFFRHVVQNLVEWRLKDHKYGVHLAILFSSFLWSAGHIGILTPEWVKLAQIFPFGIILGILYRRFGFEIVALIHAVFNIVMIFVTPYFLNI